MIILGLTGSIGAGKSFVAECLRQLDVPVFDADECVHQLLAAGGKGVALVSEAFPLVMQENGSINRQKLGALVFFDEANLKKLEAILHPLVREAGNAFLQQAIEDGKQVMVQDIPLLYETGAEKDCHAVMVVAVPEAIQEARVLQREGMTASKLEAIRGLQMPDSEKIARADYVLDGTLPKPLMLELLRQIIHGTKNLARKH